MNWRDYEKEILKYFQLSYPQTTIKYDQKIVGKYSKVDRQIDILIEGNIAGFNLRIIADCKFFSEKIDVKDVESFASMVEDVDAHQGVLITSKGYSNAAINRAFYGPKKVELDILNFDEMQKFQGTSAVPFAGNFSVFIPAAPFGWVIDIKDKINNIATLFQRGLTLSQAQKQNEWMYIDFWRIFEDDFSIDNLIAIQNAKIVAGGREADFQYRTNKLRKDNYETKIRIADVKVYSCLEVTGFIKFEKYIFFAVLFTPKELFEKNIRKLEFILSISVPAEMNFDNTKVIEQLKKEIETTSSEEEKSIKHYKIGIWYRQMKDYANEFYHLEKTLEYVPRDYDCLKLMISDQLEFGKIEEAIKYSSKLFELEPENPTLPQDLIDIYTNQKKVNDLIKFFEEKISQHTEAEILGNLYFHLGFFKLRNGLDGSEDLDLARTHFEKVFPKEHEVFTSIRTMLGTKS